MALLIVKPVCAWGAYAMQQVLSYSLIIVSKEKENKELTPNADLRNIFSFLFCSVRLFDKKIHENYKRETNALQLDAQNNAAESWHRGHLT